tara:strand:- start:137 stop:1183 length:1047 start_codon:yes stop_codon:yes gene_type:complete
MARKRNKRNEGLPARVRWKNGAYRYLVPKGQEDKWDGKTEFRLGKTESEMYLTLAGRIAASEGAIRTIGQLLDRYLYEVVPDHSPASQVHERGYIEKLREAIGHNEAAAWASQDAYRLRDHFKSKSVKGSGETYANRLMGCLKHVFTKAVEWGVVETHPMTDSNFKMFPRRKSSLRIPEWQEVLDALELAPAMLQGYVRLKLMLGLRRTDMLSLTEHDIHKDGIHVTLEKTKNSTGQITIFKMGHELMAVLNQIRAVPPRSIHYLFTTRRGEPHIKADKSARGFQSMWTRWQKKLPEEKRFTERSLRNLVGSAGDLQTASDRLGHASTATTKKYYRSKITKVTPLSSV